VQLCIVRIWEEVLGKQSLKSSAEVGFANHQKNSLKHAWQNVEAPQLWLGGLLLSGQEPGWPDKVVKKSHNVQPNPFLVEINAELFTWKKYPTTLGSFLNFQNTAQRK
jgi:hypothetical protein